MGEGRWRDAGRGGGTVESVIDAVFGGGGSSGGLIGDTKIVVNTESGEYHEVYCGWRQTTDEPIEKGQFKKKKKKPRLAGA